jgi:vacuolar-type H+-ATPase subunit I/STV1
MSVKKRKWGNLLSVLGFIFIWIIPITYVAYIAIDITNVTPTTTESGSRLVFSVWAVLILGIMLLVYVLNVRKRLVQVLHISDIQGRPVPAFWRFIQLVEYAISFAMLIGAVYVIGQLSSVLYTFGIVSLISGAIGYTLLMIDSIRKERIYQEDKLLGK